MTILTCVQCHKEPEYSFQVCLRCGRCETCTGGEMREHSEPMLTTEEVTGWVNRIREIADDDEAAHSEEDDLRHAVLETLAPTSPLAAIALTTSEITFARWCA